MTDSQRLERDIVVGDRVLVVNSIDVDDGVGVVESVHYGRDVTATVLMASGKRWGGNVTYLREVVDVE